MPAQAVTSNPFVTCSFPSTVFGILNQNHCTQFLPKGKTLSPTTSKWWMFQMIPGFASPLKDILSTSAICWDFQAPQASSCFHFCSLMYQIFCGCYSANLDFSRNWKQFKLFHVWRRNPRIVSNVPPHCSSKGGYRQDWDRVISQLYTKSETTEWRGRNVIAGKRRVTYLGPSALLQAVILQGERLILVYIRHRSCALPYSNRALSNIRVK